MQHAQTPFPVGGTAKELGLLPSLVWAPLEPEVLGSSCPLRADKPFPWEAVKGRDPGSVRLQGPHSLGLAPCVPQAASARWQEAVSGTPPQSPHLCRVLTRLSLQFSGQPRLAEMMV